MREDMRDDMHRESRTSAERAGVTPGTTRGLSRLSDLDEWKVADGDPDIRGWQVRGSDGRTIGKVDELLVDVDARRVRYLDVEVDRSLDASDRHVLVPIGTARLDDDNDLVSVSQASTELLGAPAYDRSRFDESHERSVRVWYDERATMDAVAGAGSAAAAATSGNPQNADLDRYGGPLYDDARFFGSRRKGREDRSYLAPSGEERDAGTRSDTQIDRERIDADRRGDPEVRDRP